MEASSSIKSIRPVDPDRLNDPAYTSHLADCVILTQDNKLLMQFRPLHYVGNPGGINIFGGHVEEGETATEAMIRELHEEVGAQVKEEDVVFIGAVTEDFTGHTEIVHIHFWHDKEGTITGCYEGEARYFDTLEDALNAPKLMDYSKWALLQCLEKGLLTSSPRTERSDDPGGMSP